MAESSKPQKTKGVGDKVVYTGDRAVLQAPFKDGGLPIKAIKNGYAYCQKADGYFTTWFSLSELKQCK